MNKKIITAFVIGLSLLTSCNSDDDNNDLTQPLRMGSELTINNTLQSETQTDGLEKAIEELFMLPQNALLAHSTLADSTEFPGFLIGLYDIDITENSIHFDLIAKEDDPNYSSIFRTIEAGTTDRYYLKFKESQEVNGFTSSNTSVNLRIDSDKVIVIEIGEGYNFNPGTSFTIELN